MLSPVDAKTAKRCQTVHKKYNKIKKQVESP
jgi:hypothetical protein